MTLGIEAERLEQIYGVTLHLQQLKRKREIINQLNRCKKIEYCVERLTELHGNCETYIPVAGNGNESIGNEWFCIVLEISLPVVQREPFPFVFFLNVIHVLASSFGEIV